jgi:dipeptidyl aminopeptidase/acylaminoacyl peptidase
MEGSPEAISPRYGVVRNVSLNPSRSLFGFSYETMTQPAEAFVSRLRQFAPQQISRSKQAAAEVPAIRSETVHWKAPDGQELEGLLAYPADYRLSAKSAISSRAGSFTASWGMTLFCSLFSVPRMMTSAAQSP